MVGSARRMALLLGLFFVVALPGVASATNSWNGYHWARTANPLTLKLGNNLSFAWQSYLSQTSSDWSQSSVLDTTVVPGQAVKRLCSATAGRDEICNGKYGQNGWLGVASIWATGSHITQGTVKVNDTYFNMAQYNTPDWREMVMCQEVGHTFGLDHQDTDFNNTNLGTCMDYTNDPARDDGFGNNEHPNQHDYDELAIIYTHLDSTNSASQPVSSGAAGESRNDWGREVARLNGGHTSVFVRDLGAGQQIVTYVIWA